MPPICCLILYDRKFRVGDHVRVRYRGQEGTVIDINGGLYMVSLSSGCVDSYSEQVRYLKIGDTVADAFRTGLEFRRYLGN